MSNDGLDTMVCVTVQKTCEKLIAEGVKCAAGGELYVVHVAKDGAKVLGSGTEGEALEYLFRAAHQNGAEMEILRSSNVEDTIISFAKQHAVDCIVMGRSRKTEKSQLPENIRKRLPSVQLRIVYSTFAEDLLPRKLEEQ